MAQPQRPPTAGFNGNIFLLRNRSHVDFPQQHQFLLQNFTFIPDRFCLTDPLHFTPPPLMSKKQASLFTRTVLSMAFRRYLHPLDSKPLGCILHSFYSTTIILVCFGKWRLLLGRKSLIHLSVREIEVLTYRWTLDVLEVMARSLGSGPVCGIGVQLNMGRNVPVELSHL